MKDRGFSIGEAANVAGLTVRTAPGRPVAACGRRTRPLGKIPVGKGEVMCEYCGCEEGFQSVKVILLSGSVVVSRHHPKTALGLVAESGKNPPERVKMISLFTDNDQTGEPVDAYYGAIRAVRE